MNTADAAASDTDTMVLGLPTPVFSACTGTRKHRFNAGHTGSMGH